jgi:hypothetical protein
MSVVVPALAGIGSSAGTSRVGAAKVPAGSAEAQLSSSTSAKKSKPAPKTRCFYTGSGKLRVRVCDVPGAAGQRGPRGFVGPHGKRGLNGAAGTTGPTGPAGSARAYALVSARNPEVELVTTETHEFTGVRRVALGTYCLTPGASISASAEPGVVASESSYSRLEPGFAPLAVLNAQPASAPNPCNGNEYKVETYRLGAKGPELSDGVAFTIDVP